MGFYSDMIFSIQLTGQYVDVEILSMIWLHDMYICLVCPASPTF